MKKLFSLQINKFDFFPTLILFLLAFFLIIIWFKDGYILGVAEGMLPFYDITHFYNEIRLSWSDTNPGLGFANGIVTAFTPTFLVLSFLERIGIPGFIIEAFFLWVQLITAGVGITLLTKELFPRISNKYLLIAGIFYWFNLLSMVNVWNRFLHGFIAIWALLPLATALYIKGINRQNYLYIFIVGIVCGIFSLGLSNPVFNIILWFVFTYITLFKVFSDRGKTNKLFYVKYFFLSFSFFCLVNLWWIGQVLGNLFLGKYSQELTNFYPEPVSIMTLNSLSNILGDLNNLFRLLHKSFFYDPFVNWATLFLNPLVVTIEFMISGIVFYYVWKTGKNINVLLLGSLLLTSFYLAKGSNPPLGELFQFIFTHVTFMQFFRNPFEKFGFLIPLAMAPLLAAGLEELSSKFRNSIRLMIYLFVLLMLTGLFGYPFWSGLVFTGPNPPNNDYSIGFKVKVPAYYEQSSKWLESQGSNFRFLGFPFNDQGVTYMWEKGYQGIETSMWLFSTPHIMFSTTSLYFDQVANQLDELLIKDQNLYKVMNILNARYIMVRSDVNFHERNMRNPDRIKEILSTEEQNRHLKSVANFGALSFFENLAWSDKTIYTSNSLIKVSPEIKLADFTLPEASSATAAYQDSIADLNKFTILEIIHPLKNKKDSSNTNPYQYQFNLQDNDNYEMIVNLPVKLFDNEFPKIEPVLRTDGLYSYNLSYLKAGLHQVELSPFDSANMAVSNTNNYEYTISDFDPYAKYLISFEYSVEQDSVLGILADNDQVKNNQHIPSYVRNLPGTSGNLFQDIYDPKDTASSIELFFSPGKPKNLVVKKMNIKKMIAPNVFLIRKVSSDTAKLPSLYYEKISPTKYRIQIKNSENPFVLVFSSTFNSGWEAVYPDESKVHNHFLVNSFANGWLIDKTGSYDLILHYTLQDNLERDSLISLLSVIGGIGILLGGTVFKRRRV